MKKLLTVTIIALFSCGNAEDSNINLNERVISTESIYTIDGFANGALGYCRLARPVNFKKHMIVMDKRYIDSLGISYELVLLHELGHCQFGLGHTPEPTFFDDGCTREIMATFLPPTATSNKCFETHKMYYLNQYHSWEQCDNVNTCPVKEFIW